MIQIDDAGNGAVLGGEVIGALRVESGEYVHSFLPLAVYSHFEAQRTTAAKDTVLELLGQINHLPGEPIVFCTGDIFKDAKDWLTLQGILWKEEKITGTLQEMVEESFFNSLRRYGLPEKLRAFHHDYHRFHNMVLSWVCNDLAHRAKYCKPLRLNSGLISRARIFQTILQKEQQCAGCRTPLKAGLPAVLDKSGEQPVYFHAKCYPSDVQLCDYQEDQIGPETARSFVNKFATPIVCAECAKVIKHKKRIVQYQNQTYHLSCFTARCSSKNELMLHI